MRRFWLVVLLSFGVGAVTSVAEAASKEELKADKERMKEAKSRWKDVSKLADKWGKAHEKEKGEEAKAEIDAELVPFYKQDIGFIRAAGVEVRGEEEAPLPGTISGGGNKPDLEPTKLEELRDVIVPLKDGETKGDDKAKALQQYARILEERYERRVSQYDAAKAES